MSVSDHDASDMPRILVVEDDAAIARLVMQVLHNEGYEVTTVSDGQRAIDEQGSDAHCAWSGRDWLKGLRARLFAQLEHVFDSP